MALCLLVWLGTVIARRPSKAAQEGLNQSSSAVLHQAWSWESWLADWLAEPELLGDNLESVDGVHV
jgi:hypothetical protein